MSTQDDATWEALWQAVGRRDRYALQAIISAAGDGGIDTKNGDGLTVLHWALRCPDPGGVRWLIEQGADVRLPDDKGRTPLHYAVWAQYVAEELLAAGADINAADNDGRTVLHYAALVDRKKVIEYLLEQGADADLADKAGRTAKQLIFRSNAMGNTVEGKRFFFVLPTKLKWLEDTECEGEVFSLLDDETAAELGFDPSGLPDLPLAAVCATKMLYGPDETVRLLVVDPARGDGEADLEVRRGTETVDTVRLRLDDLGCGLQSIRGLAEGTYTAALADTDVTADFTVAAYQLAPLHATLQSTESRRRGSRLWFQAMLTSFGSPMWGSVRVELMQGERRTQSIQADVREGLVEAELKLPKGDQALTINFIADEKSASVPVRGGRESERTPLVANPLGRVVEVSTLPPGDPCRGLYFCAGRNNSEPFAVLETVSATCAIEVHTGNVRAAKIVVVDPVNRTARHLDMPHTSKGARITVDVDDPYSVVFIGAIVGNKAYEAYTMVVRPVELEVDVHLAETLLPGNEAVATIRTNQADRDVAVLITVTDGRAVMPETVVSALAGRIKGAAEAIVDGMTPGRPVPPPYSRRRRGAERDDLAIPPESVDRAILGMATFGSEGFALAAGPCDAMLDELDTGLNVETAVETATATDARQRRPETVLCRLIHVRGSQQVAFHTPQSITTLRATVQAVRGFDCAVIERDVEVTKDVYGELVVPPFVHPGDVATGSVAVGCRAGEFSIEFTRDGEPVEVRMGGEAVPAGETIAAEQASFAFDVQPGEYQVAVTAADGEVDVACATVAEPGKLRYDARTIQLLQPGESVSMTDDPSIIRIALLPGLEAQFKTAIQVTADYDHLCCEQTAAKIAAAAMMYVSGDDDDRNRAEAIILAGIKREETMHVPGKGFHMYPDMSSVVEYWSTYACRHLLSALPPLSKLATAENSPALQDACRRGLEMAHDGAKAHGLSIPPNKINSCRDAYEVLTADDASRRGAAVDFAAEKLQPQGAYLAVDDGEGIVERRAETAFAAAVLFLTGGAHLARAVRATNWVTSQMRDDGAWYSTVDCVAGLSMMAAMIDAKAVVTGGDDAPGVTINGQAMTYADALDFDGEVHSVAAAAAGEAVLPVQVVYRREEDWGQFVSGADIRVKLLDPRGREVRPDKVRQGDVLQLAVRIEDGYESGDLCFVCLPPCLSFVYGGGQIKMMSVDFEGADEITIPLAVTASPRPAQHWAVCLRNMFQEERGGNPGLQTVGK